MYYVNCQKNVFEIQSKKGVLEYQLEYVGKIPYCYGIPHKILNLAVVCSSNFNQGPDELQIDIRV